MNQNLAVIDQLKRDEQKIRRKIEALQSSIQKELVAAEADLGHILGAIAYYERDKEHSRQFTLNAASNEWETLKLRGMTHKEAVVAIAKKNNGVVRSQDAKRLMISAGVMKATKNSSRMVHNAIKSANLFEPIAPGEYRLKETSSKSGSAVFDPSKGAFADLKPVQ
ncbi:MAG: hypothetical protein ABSF59_21185 [Candidatus Sulfotelmatobacter sp.]|jgi:hypothetical protein